MAQLATIGLLALLVALGVAFMAAVGLALEEARRWVWRD